MRAALWWIDRWRQSTAYTDMTAEEQGLYRNLCDEVWLRDDHVIPDEPRILARVSGDPEAWGRCATKVLGWMKRVNGGWTNETALEVIEQSDKRAERQRRYRIHKDNTSDNEQRNAAGLAGVPPSSPSDSPNNPLQSGAVHRSQEQEQERTAGNGSSPPAASPPEALLMVVAPTKTPTAEACEDWAEFLGTAPGGRIGAALKPLWMRHGWDVVRLVWRDACERAASEEDPSYFTPETFARTFLARLSGPKPGAGRSRTAAQTTVAAVRSIVAREEAKKRDRQL